MISTKTKIKGHIGTWHVIDETFYYGEKVYLLEHDTYGDEAACLIVNEKLEIILDDVWNGFSDLDDYEMREQEIEVWIKEERDERV